jgi:hypothetical protein
VMKPWYLFAAILAVSIAYLYNVHSKSASTPVQIDIPVNTSRAQFRPENTGGFENLDWDEIDAWDRRVRDRQYSPKRLPSDIKEMKAKGDIEEQYKRFRLSNSIDP